LSSPPLDLLRLEGVVAGYGPVRVIEEVSATVGLKEVVAIIGRNGAGKSTLLKTIFGVLPLESGSIRVDGQSLPPGNPQARLELGVGYVPQGGRVFGALTVGENLLIGGGRLPKAQRNREIERVLAWFPMLRERLYLRAGKLSGGERQMLALGTALIRSPRLLLLDEPSLGLAPARVPELLATIRRIVRAENGSALIVEQKIREVLRCSDRAWVLQDGRLIYNDASDRLIDGEQWRRLYFSNE
jgi:branched-chain amino acid transport system ATP-binding protein